MHYSGRSSHSPAVPHSAVTIMNTPPSTSPMSPPRRLRFADRFWGAEDAGFDVLMELMKAGKHTGNELLELFKMRADMEEEFGKKLVRFVRAGKLGADEKEGPLQSALLSFLGQTEAHAKSRLALAETIRAQLEKPLAQMLNDQRDRRKEHQAAVEKSSKNRQLMITSVHKAEEKYRARCTELDALQQQRAKALDLVKFDAKIQKAMGAMKQADVDYQFAVERLQEIHAGWVKDMYTACEEFQQLDEERIAYVRNILWAYANANSAASVADDACMEATRACLEKLDVSAAIDRFIADHGTGSDIPAPLTYRNYYEVQTSPNQQRAMATLKDYGVMVRSARSLVGVGKSPVDRPSRETALRSSSAALAAAPAPAVSTLAQQLSFSLATQSAAPGEVAPAKSPTTKALPSPFAEDIVVAAEEHIPPKQDLHQAVANSYSSSECEPSPPPAYKSMEVDAQSTAEQSVPDTNPFASEMQEVTRVADEKAIPAPIVNDEGKAVPAPTPKETVVQSWNPFD